MFLFNYSFWPTGFACRDCRKESRSICRSPDCAYLKFWKISAVVRSAKKNVDLCIALYTLKDGAGDLIELQRKGIRVRIIVDSKLLTEGIQGSDVMETLKNKDVLVKKAKVQGLMHHKFVIVDNSILLNGSMNWTNSGFFGNYENMEISNDKEAIKAFSSEFEILWNRF